MTIAQQTQQRISDLANFESCPCSGCEFYKDCMENKKACHRYFNHVLTDSSQPLKIRSKALFNGIEEIELDKGVKLRSFLNAIKAARKTDAMGIFYRLDDGFFTFANIENKRYRPLKNNPDYRLVGFFGPEFSEQEISDYLEEAIKKWQH